MTMPHGDAQGMCVKMVASCQSFNQEV